MGVELKESSEIFRLFEGNSLCTPQMKLKNEIERKEEFIDIERENDRKRNEKEE